MTKCWASLATFAGALVVHGVGASAQPRQASAAQTNLFEAERFPNRVRAPRRVRPRLTASDVSGPAGEPITLKIFARATPATAGSVVFLGGVPRQALLSTGFDMGGGRWLVLADKVRHTRIVVSPNAPRRFRIEATLLGRELREALSKPAAFTVRLTPAKAASR